MSLSRKAMVEYLTSHFRYDTMSSWNQSTAYAACVKIHGSWVPRDLQDKAFAIYDQGDVFDDISGVMREWDASNHHKYQVGFNGRSGGYIVMYRGGEKPSEYKSVCQDCGQKNYSAGAVKCGRCGSTNMHDFSGMEVFSYPGQSIDQGEYFDEWDLPGIRDRYKLVRSFDKMIENCKAVFLQYCREYKVVEKEVMVPKKVQVLEPVTASGHIPRTC